MNANQATIEAVFVEVINGSMGTGVELPLAPKSVRGEARQSKAERNAAKAARSAMANGHIEDSKAIARQMIVDAREKEKESANAASDAANLKSDSAKVLQLGKLEGKILVALQSATESVFTLGSLLREVSDSGLYKVAGHKTVSAWYAAKFDGYSERSLNDAKRLATIARNMSWDIPACCAIPAGSLLQIARIKEHDGKGAAHVANQAKIWELLETAKTAKMAAIKSLVDTYLGKDKPDTDGGTDGAESNGFGGGSKGDDETVTSVTIMVPNAVLAAFCQAMKLDIMGDETVIGTAIVRVMQLAANHGAKN